jgi:hypothetical protein
MVASVSASAATPVQRCLDLARRKVSAASASGQAGPPMTDLAICNVMAGYPGFTPHGIAAMNAKTRRAWLRAGFGRDD